MKVSLAILGFLFIGSLMLVGTVIGTYNGFVQAEGGLVAQYKDNQNTYDNMWKKLKESSQVTSMMTDDIEKVYKSALQGRYGEGGSKAVFQMLKEQNPNIDATLYKQLQSSIEANRSEFQANQKMLTDKKRAYETSLQSFPNNIIAGLVGFPRIDLSKYDIVTSEKTDKVFESKNDNQEIKLRD